MSVSGPAGPAFVNSSLLTGCVQSDFKHASDLPIPKKTNLKPTLPLNYGPISEPPFL